MASKYNSLAEFQEAERKKKKKQNTTKQTQQHKTLADFQVAEGTAKVNPIAKSAADIQERLFSRMERDAKQGKTLNDREKLMLSQMGIKQNERTEEEKKNLTAIERKKGYGNTFVPIESNKRPVLPMEALNQKMQSNLHQLGVANQKEEEDIAPVKGGNKDSVFKSGGFSDGVDGVGDFLGDLGQTVAGTAGDAALGILKGGGRMIEGVADAAMYGIYGLEKLHGQERNAQITKRLAQRNLVDEMTQGATDYVDQYSVLGNKADMVSEGIGQVGTLILTGSLGEIGMLGQAGQTALTMGMTGISGVGSGMSEAYSQGATDKEAAIYGLIAGTVEAGTEMMFGGLGKASKALGIGKSAIAVDDWVAKKITKGITNQIAKNMVEWGIKATAEGVEEVVAGSLQALAKRYTYLSDEVENGETTLKQIFKDENLLEQFIVGAVTSGFAQSGLVPGMKSGSVREANKQGRDFITGYTQSDQTVIDRVVEERVAAKEKNGETVTKKQRAAIEEQVQQDLEKGYISVDTIESILGGDDYTAYKQEVDSNEELKRELETLRQMKKSDMNDIQSERLEELKRMNLEDTTKRDSLRAKLDETLSPMLQYSRLTESYNERARRGEALQIDVEQYKGKQREAVERAIQSGVLNNTNRSRELVDILSRIEADKGIVFNYTDNTRLKESGFAVEGKTVNGFVNNGEVTLNVQSAKAFESVVGHEITHVLEGTEAYGALQKTLFDYAQSKGELESRRANLAQLYKNVQNANLDAELTADLVGDYLFTDSDFVKHLTGNENIFKRVYNEIKYLCKVATGKELTELEKVKRQFDKVWKEYNANKKGSSVTQSKGIGDVAFSVSEDAPSHEQYYGRALSAVEMFGTITDYDRAGFAIADGRLLNMSKYGQKGTRHRMIEGVFEDVQGDAAINQFIQEGNVRFKASAPGIEIGETLAPTTSQRNAMSRFINHCMAKNDYFYLDITGKNGDSIASVTYYGNDARPSEILYDIEKYYSDGRIPKGSTGTYYSISEDTNGNELSVAVQKRFANSKAVDENGRLKVVYHGTASGEFYTFDKSKGSVEGDFGSGFYFTDNESDVENNYEGGGADFENKVARRAEQIETEEDIDYSEAEQRARKELYVGSNKHEVYLNIENPAIVGKTNLLDYESFAEEYDQADYDSEEDWEGDVEQLIADTIDQIIWDVDRNVDVYNTDGLAEVLWNAVNEGGIDIEQLKANINNLYLEDSNGNLVGNEVTRQIIESLGYDGIIDNTVSSKFSNMGLTEDTTHYIVFKPNQIKSITNENPTDNPDIRYSLSNEGETSPFGTPMNEMYYEPKQETIGETETTAPVENNVDVVEEAEEIAPTIEAEPQKSDLPNFAENQIANYKATIAEARAKANGNRKPTNSGLKRYLAKKPAKGADGKPKTSLQGANVADGKQYMSIDTGAAIVVMNTADETLPVNSELNIDSIKRVTQKVEEGTIDGNYEIDAIDISLIRKEVQKGSGRKNLVVVGDNCYNIDYVDAILKAIENPEISLAESNMGGGFKFLVINGSNGKAFVSPVNIKGRNLEGTSFVYRAEKIGADVADDIAPVAEAAPEVEAPIQETEAPMPTDYAPMTEAEANAVQDAKVRADEAIAPQPPQQRPQQKTAQVLTQEPNTQPKKNLWNRFLDKVFGEDRGKIWHSAVRNLLDKGAVFENLSLQRKNRAIMDAYKVMGRSESKAQYFMEHGKEGVKSLRTIVDDISKMPNADEFQDYLYHKHNIARMNLESREQPNLQRLEAEMKRLKLLHLKKSQLKAIAATKVTEKTPEKRVLVVDTVREYLKAKAVKNKPVFGDHVTAEISERKARMYENNNPEFVKHAQDIYNYMNSLRQMLVDNGIISEETAKLWAETYPYYVPIRREGKDGASIAVPLDTNKTGVNAPIKGATGGNSDILPLLNTMALRTVQTFKAVDRNNFGFVLKNALGETTNSTATDFDGVINGIVAQDDLMEAGKNGSNPTFTFFENGERVTFDITEEMYEAMKPTSDAMASTFKPLNALSSLHKKVLTQYNLFFAARNAIKDAQDVLLNSQHAVKTYANFPQAVKELLTGKGNYVLEYWENGGKQNTYFDRNKNDFAKEDSTFKKVVGFPIHAISSVNEFIEAIPRLAEYIASRKSGATIEAAMLDAARVTTDFSAGGDVTKFLNRNGMTFLNASVQGAMQQVRNVREAKANGLKGILKLASKYAAAGLPAVLMNALFWDGDDEYEELSDYVKDNYYVVAKTNDGEFVRIPKGRMVSVIQEIFEQIGKTAKGEESDWANIFTLARENIAPNNPIDNNVIAPVIQAVTNKTWFGEDLVPQRLQDVPTEEQFDETIDSLSKWLGENTGLSPYKFNYILNQYSGFVGDIVLPPLTPDAERGDTSGAGNLIAPLKDQFTVDGVMKNQNVGDFYDKAHELKVNANSMYATDEDKLKGKYMNAVNNELGELYAKQREIRNSNLSDDVKYARARSIQKQINELAETALNSYNNVMIDNGYATVGDKHYRMDDGVWTKISDKQLERQNEVTSQLGISPSEYWSKTEISFFPTSDGEYEYAADNPGGYAVSQAVGGYDNFKTYTKDLRSFRKGENESNEQFKARKAEYIAGLDLDEGEKLILFKYTYKGDDNYNTKIVNYLSERDDISWEDKVTILTELGFTVQGDNVYWD